MTSVVDSGDVRAEAGVPTPGQLVTVRNRQWITSEEVRQGLHTKGTKHKATTANPPGDLRTPPGALF